MKITTFAFLFLMAIMSGPAHAGTECQNTFLVCVMGCGGNQACQRNCKAQSEACHARRYGGSEDDDDDTSERRRQQQMEQQRQQMLYQQQLQRQQYQQQELQRQQAYQQQLERQRQMEWERQQALRRQQEEQRQQEQQRQAARQREEPVRNDPRAFATECIQQLKNTHRMGSIGQGRQGYYQTLVVHNRCSFDVWFFGVVANHKRGQGGLVKAGQSHEFNHIDYHGEGLLVQFKACNPKYDKDHYCAGKADGLGGPLY